MKHFSSILLCSGMLLFAIASNGQPDSLIRERIAVTARASTDSITLRWAPATFDTWQRGNQYGYRVERYTIARNGHLLTPAVRHILDPTVRCLPEEGWESLVKRNRYAAIAAQALYGEAFQVDLSRSDVVSIVNKVRENEQRFAFALFAADMSPAVARASGLWFTDHAVNPVEKYLYRVIINSNDSLRGSVFVVAGGSVALPAPRNLQGEFKEQLVSLRWDSQNQFYSAYRVERSTDGKTFEPISDTPLVTVSPSAEDDGRYQYAIDSLRDLATVYHYRVVGLTPFGEESPPSSTVSGRGSPHVRQVPYITAAENIGNTAIKITWDFPVDDNNAITGFQIVRTEAPTKPYDQLTPSELAPDLRMWVDKSPGRVNYYRVKALGRDGQVYASPVYYAQLVDSIPPAVPAGLQATVDDTGAVYLTWNANNERDLLGYRVYKSYYKSEEPTQATTGPVPDTSFTDHVDLHTLNAHVYYHVMAIDGNQNHSALSPRLIVSLPDQVAPQPPVFLPAKSSSAGVDLSWIPSPSMDVATYSIYRKSSDAPGWSLLNTLPNHGDSIYHYRDGTATAGMLYFYTVLAMDEAGLESQAASPVTATRMRSLAPPIVWRKPVMNREEHRLTLRWSFDMDLVDHFRLYIAINKGVPMRFGTIPAKERTFTDTLIPGRHYEYRIVAHLKDGRQSQLSEPLVFDY